MNEDRDRWPSPSDDPECDHQPGHDCCECNAMDAEELAEVRASSQVTLGH